ncbi:hypothetical protein EYF80_041590 [Liparis tanakae]|uniref:Uncharacterized protein n=1 Tax=Liparis tanakae TaxID=230148 RepID=A0A4Z2G515_9TELE|nr:hypothetical protein EYF80_041590 [Liparis tanakae]
MKTSRVAPAAACTDVPEAAAGGVHQGGELELLTVSMYQPGLGARGRREDTVDDEEAEVPQQQNRQDEGRAAQKVPRAFWLLNAPAAPGGQRANQDGAAALC